MSIRDTMRKRAEDAKSVIGSFKFQRDDLTKTIEVLEFAEKVLAGEPRGETKCRLSKHYTLTSGYFQRADCSECGETVQGWEKSWRFCPKCGSTIQGAETEESPNERISRNAAKAVFAQEKV